MLDIGFFYLLLLILILLLFIIIFLYSGYHTRVLAPALMNSNYGIGLTGGTAINGVFNNIVLNDGESVGGDSGGIAFNGAGASEIPFKFLPLTEDRNRKINGKIVIFGYSSVNNDPGTAITLRLIDEGDNNREVGQATDYSFKGFDYGLQKIELVFNSKNINNSNNTHQFVLQGRTKDGGTVASNRILINSAYLLYY